MFHYVFLDPATIDEAVAAGEMGLGRLVELMNDFRRDVLLAETDAWRVDEELGERVRSIPDKFQHERKQIGDLLTWLRRHGPTVIIEGDADSNLSLSEFARSKAVEADLDMILSPGETECPENTWVKVCLAKCHTTALNRERANLAPGRTFTSGEKNFDGFASDCFAKLVRHAEVVRVYDYALGEYYNNDQPVNLKRLVRFLRDHAPRLLRLEILTLSPAKISLERDVGDLQNEVDFRIDVQFRANKADLPHPRYLGADNRYLDIDRGIDLCDAHDRCRLTKIKYAGSPE